MTTESKTFYALRDIYTQELIRVSNEMSEYRQHYHLTLDSSKPVYEAATADAAAFVLMEDTSDYSSSEICPGWGDLNGNELEIVKVQQIVNIEPVVVSKPLQYSVREMPRRLPRMVAKQYTEGRVLDDSVKQALVGLVTLPEGMTLEQARAFEGQQVYPETNKFGGSKLIMAMPAPSNYADQNLPPNVVLFLLAV